MVVDWSSQLWLGLPGLEGLPGFRMVGGWSSCGFQGCICTGWWEGKICWGHLGGVIAGSMKLIGLQKDMKLVNNNIIYD